MKHYSFDNAKYFSSVKDWFSGFASFVNQNEKNKTNPTDIDKLLYSKLEWLIAREKKLREFLSERKVLEKECILKLEQLISKCAGYINMESANNVISNNLLFKWEEQIILSEREILREKLNCFHDRLNLERELWKVEKEKEEARHNYNLFLGL